MTRFPILAALAGGLALTAAPALAQSNAAATHGKAAEAAQASPVALSDVPKPALDAAKTALGAEPSTAKSMKHGGQTVYWLAAKDASGKSEAVVVSADGKVLKKKEAVK
jgi:hypothetical protein